MDVTKDGTFTINVQVQASLRLQEHFFLQLSLYISNK